MSEQTDETPRLATLPELTRLCEEQYWRVRHLWLTGKIDADAYTSEAQPLFLEYQVPIVKALLAQQRAGRPTVRGFDEEDEDESDPD